MSFFDPISQGIHDFYYKKINDPIIIHSDGFDDDEVYPDYFFRTYGEMPVLEQKAMDLASGNVLDIGAAAGCHSIHLQNKGMNVTALEKAPLCCDIMKDRGIQNIECSDIHQYNGLFF